jgi:hypothetical protein
MKLIKRPVYRIFSLNIVITLTMFMGNVSAQPIGACGPVDYYHEKVLDASKRLDSWHKDANGPFEYIVNLSAEWWKKVPDVNGWPSWCTAAELNRHYKQSNGAVPGSTCSFAILACLKYYVYSGDSVYLNMARRTGDYIIQRDLTPSTFKSYPDFPYPVGKLGDISPDGSGHPSYSDKYNPAGHIQPDKGAMIGFALLELYKVTGNRIYLNTAINIANCLTNNVVRGTADVSPWPMRVMATDNKLIDGKFEANVSYACRLFDGLLEVGQKGNGKYKETRNAVWNWLKTYVIPFDDGSKWLDFFEDHMGDEVNSTQINALETVRYILEKKQAADPDWFNLSGMIIQQVLRRWSLSSQDVQGFVCIAEQDQDQSPYNSHTSRLGSILAMYYEAVGDKSYKDMAYHSLCYGVYSVEDDGFASTYYKKETTAWTSDSFGDFIGHFVYAFGAVPEWAGEGNHLLKSSSTVKRINYEGTRGLSYSTFETSGADKLKLTNKPSSVLVNGKIIISYTWDDKSSVLVINRTGGSNVIVKLAR